MNHRLRAVRQPVVIQGRWFVRKRRRIQQKEKKQAARVLDQNTTFPEIPGKSGTRDNSDVSQRRLRISNPWNELSRSMERPKVTKNETAWKPQAFNFKEIQ
jgi:hypothetical protein